MYSVAVCQRVASGALQFAERDESLTQSLPSRRPKRARASRGELATAVASCPCQLPSQSRTRQLRVLLREREEKRAGEHLIGRANLNFDNTDFLETSGLDAFVWIVYAYDSARTTAP